MSDSAGRGGAAGLQVPAIRANLEARTVVSASRSASADERRGDNPISDVIAMNKSGSGEEAAAGDERDVVTSVQSTVTSTGDADNDTVVSVVDVEKEDKVPDKSGVRDVDSVFATVVCTTTGSGASLPSK